MQDGLLDDPEAVAAADTGSMLAAVASAGAQVRRAVVAVSDAGVGTALAADKPPRAVVVTAMGGSAISGDVLHAVVGQTSPVPVFRHRGYGLPAWIGTDDLVIGVSASGSTEETLSAVAEAVRRRTRLLTVGAPASQLADLCDQAGGLHVAVDSGGRQPRACIWSLSVPLLVAAGAAGLGNVPATVLESTADRLDDIARRCGPAADGAVNPAKVLARHLGTGMPLLWGSSALAGVAARRFACQINENAQLPAVWGELPEASHNQIVALDGPASRDVRLVILRDPDEQPQLSRRRAITAELAESHGVAVTEVRGEGIHPLERLASLIAVTDYASVYLALLLGVDPTPIWPITYLKERLAMTNSPMSRTGTEPR